MINQIRLINEEEFKKFYNITDKELLRYTLEKIIEMNNNMLSYKKQQKFEKDRNDKEYKRIVKKYLTIFDMLNKYWSEDEIVEACAKHLTTSDIAKEQPIPCERIHCQPEKYNEYYHYPEPMEYKRTGLASVRRYTKSGDELLYGETKMCHIYMTTNEYQGIHHGNIILELLYSTYPELKEFEFKAYKFHNHIQYEIYPSGINCYTPFDALMESDIEAIIKRNEGYCKAYNAGIYTLEKWNERVNSPEIQHYFNIIKNLSRKERTV